MPPRGTRMPLSGTHMPPRGTLFCLHASHSLMPLRGNLSCLHASLSHASACLAMTLCSRTTSFVAVVGNVLGSWLSYLRRYHGIRAVV